MAKINTALESIQFQKTDLFVGITNCIKKIRTTNPKLKDDAFYSTPEVKELSALINNITGIRFEFADSSEGPAVFIPRIDQHIFDAPGYVQTLKELYAEFDQNYDLGRVLKMLNKDLVDGTVDLKNAKVTGVFNSILCKMFLPKDYLFNPNFLDEEMSAIILHEIGHVFTSFEYLSRSVSTNQSLSIMLRMCDKTVSYEDRKMVFGKAKERLDMSDEAFKLIQDEKDITKVTMVVMNDAIRECKSELGASVYDLVSCEYLADQFSTRHGAGKYLVTALDKIMGDLSQSLFATVMTTINSAAGSFVVVAMTGSFLAGAVAFILFAIFFTSLDSYNDTRGIYDNNYTRFSRIKHQLVQRLKDPSVQEDEKKTLVKYIEEVDPIIKKNLSDENVKLRNKIAMFFSSEHKRDFEYMRLQKDLELLGNSDLFVMSEKLKLV